MRELKQDIELIAQVAPSLTVAQLADKWGVKRDLMYRLLYAHDIEFKRAKKGRPSESVNFDAAKLLADNGSVKSAAYELGVTPHAIYQKIYNKGLSISQHKAKLRQDMIDKINERINPNGIGFTANKVPFAKVAREIYPNITKLQVDALRRHCKIKKAANK